MNAISNLFVRLERYIFHFPIFNRVLAGNAIVILIGAIGGTILTRHLVLFGNFWLILLFASLGIFLTLLVNYWIIKTALRPLKELGQTVAQVNEGQTHLPESIWMRSDPEIHQLVLTINSLLERLDRRARQLRALSERAISAQEEERRRIARGLHDDTAQALSSLIIELERMEATYPKDRQTAQEKLANFSQIVVRILEDLRKIIWDLRPTILDDLGLVPAIRWFTRSKLEEAGIRVTFDILAVSTRLPSRLETTLFRVTQEAVHNIIRHSQAKNVTIHIREENEHICLTIEDDGQGFDIPEINIRAVSQKQLGLLGIQERVSLVGGKVILESQPGAGTCIQVCVPNKETSSMDGEDENLTIEGEETGA